VGSGIEITAGWEVAIGDRRTCPRSGEVGGLGIWTEWFRLDKLGRVKKVKFVILSVGESLAGRWIGFGSLGACTDYSWLW
jgi:hypothetical protein